MFDAIEADAPSLGVILARALSDEALVREKDLRVAATVPELPVTCVSPVGSPKL